MSVRKLDSAGLTTQKGTTRGGDLGWVLLVLGSGLHDGATRRHALPADGTITIGRGADCDVVLDHASVSRQHARLRVEDRLTLTIEDLGSSNGTRVGGVLLGPGEVRPVIGDVSIEIGDLMAVARRLPKTSPTGDDPTERGAAIETPGLAPVLAIVDRAAVSELPVLVSGETGVGKEHIAARVVAKSRRVGKPFLRVNVAAMSETLIESELFGHERGAFTGADRKKPGVFELASTGTLFLDEIGDLPMPLQAKLLRVLEEQAVWPVGAQRPVPIDVRFVAATHQDLLAKIEAGTFRQDLYFRLCGVKVEVPPLRARPQDITPLADLFATRCATALGFPLPRWSASAQSALAAHTWPGNVRELRFACERAVVLAGADPIEPAHLQLGPARTASGSSTSLGARLAGSNDSESERTRIIKALEQCAGNQTQAARLLGISRGTLVARLDELGLPRPRRR